MKCTLYSALAVVVVATALFHYFNTLKSSDFCICYTLTNHLARNRCFDCCLCTNRMRIARVWILLIHHTHTSTFGRPLSRYSPSMCFLSMFVLVCDLRSIHSHTHSHTNSLDRIECALFVCVFVCSGEK